MISTVISEKKEEANLFHVCQIWGFHEGENEDGFPLEGDPL